MGPAFFFAVSGRWLLYTGHFAQLVQLGPGVGGRNKQELAVFNMQRPLMIDRFHSSDNTLSENAAYQLVSGRIYQRRRYTFYKEFECSKVS